LDLLVAELVEYQASNLLGPESWQLARTELRLDPEGYREWLLNSLSRAFQHAGAARG
jgi:hypothetical protein